MQAVRADAENVLGAQAGKAQAVQPGKGLAAAGSRR
jgi:hypothetical protein